MELAFVLTALRRRVLIILLFTALGLTAGLFLAPTLSTKGDWESSAVLSIRPPTRSDVVFDEPNDPDRYVLGEMAVLESQQIAERVAGEVGMERGDVSRQVTVTQQPDSNLVTVDGTAPDAESAQRLTQAFSEAYLSSLERGDTSEQDRLEQEIVRLEQELAEVNLTLDDAIEAGTTATRVPTAEQASPAAAAERQLILGQLERNQTALDNLNQARPRINTTLVQAASSPGQAANANGIIVPLSVAAGFILGTVLALTMARFSNKVQDDRAAEVILGVPVVGELAHYRSLAREHLAAFQQLPDEAIPVIEQLCVRAEAKAQLNVPLTVAVVGTQRGAGTTTLALAMAERFAGLGSSVVLVDADVRDPRVTELFHAGVDGGIPSILVNDGALVDQRGRSVFTRTMDPEVRVLGLGPNRAVASLRRDTVSTVIRAACHQGAVVVVDGGPVFDLASTVQLTQLVDAVVVAVPLQRQKANELTDLSRQLAPVGPKLLPVITNPALRSARDRSVRFEGEQQASAYAGSSQTK